MRRDDSPLALRRHLREQVQRIGIPDAREFEPADNRKELARPFGSPETGAERNCRRLLEQRCQGIRISDAMAHQFGSGTDDDRCVRRVRGNSYEARTGAERRLARQPDCAGHAFAAADDQHVAEIALVSASGTPLEAAAQDPARYSPAHGLRLRTAVLRYVEAVERDDAAEFRPFTREQSRLQPHEGHREIGLDRCAHHLPGIAVDPGRYVERHHVGPMGIHGRHGLCKFAGNVALETAAQQGIHDQSRLIVQHAFPRHDDAAFRGKITVRGRRIAGQRFRIHERKHGNDDAVLCGEPRDNVAIARIVAGTAHDLPALRVRKPLPRGADRRSAGSRHQRVARNALVFDRPAIDLTHGRNGIDFDG